MCTLYEVWNQGFYNVLYRQSHNFFIGSFSKHISLKLSIWSSWGRKTKTKETHLLLCVWWCVYICVFVICVVVTDVKEWRKPVGPCLRLCKELDRAQHYEQINNPSPIRQTVLKHSPFMIFYSKSKQKLIRITCLLPGLLYKSIFS